MNHLAHLLLAGPDEALRVGGFLGDFVRGRLKGDYSAAIERGIALHRHIDVTTDRHPAVREALTHFEGDPRRWAPVALDVWFDYLLARDFVRHAGEPLEAFADAALEQLMAHRDVMPPRAQQYLDRLIEHRILVRYRDADTIAQVLARMAMRSPRATPLASITPVLHRLEDELRDTFGRLLPDLRFAVQNWLRSESGHGNGEA